LTGGPAAAGGRPSPGAARERVATLTLHPALDQTVTLERLVPGAVHQAEAMRFDAGGKGVNVAAFLADAGVPVAATGLLGEENAAPFAALFAAKGIEDAFVRVPGTTRINVKLAETARRETTDINLPAPRAPAAALAELERRVLALADRCGWFVLAGSVPPGVPPGIYAALTARLRERGCRVAVDTSGAPLAPALDAGPDLAKPNRAELEQLVGARLPALADVARAARELRRRGPRIVVVSMGAEGALFTGAEGAWLARPPAVTVATTVGAGDALVAGLVASLREGRSLEAAARRATAFAAAKVGRVGPHLGPAEDVRALEARVDVRPFEEA
jgi:1-phosphofructokinase